MRRQRRSFSLEFKHDAASLVLDQGYSRRYTKLIFFEMCQASLIACFLESELVKKEEFTYHFKNPWHPEVKKM